MTALVDVGVPLRRVGGRSRALGRIGLALLGAFVALALLTPVLRPYKPDALSSDSLQGPSLRHLLGTNPQGQDLASQMLEGARASLLVAMLAGAGTLLLGASAGMLAGLLRGWVDVVIMRVVDVLLAVPRLPLLILIGIYAGRDLKIVAVVIALVFWPGTARAIRSQVLSLRRRTHIKAAMGFGGGPLHVLRRHIVPEISLILLANLLSAMGRAIMLEAGLAFLGIGDPSRTSWGSIMRDAQSSSGLYYSRAYLWWMVPPVLASVLSLLSLTFIGMSVEQRVNPRLARHTSGRSDT